MCGEKCGYRLPFRSIVGSPPHVRGKVKVGLFVGHSVRITPACAGKSITERGFKNGIEDHPRVCGEKAVLVHF